MVDRSTKWPFVSVLLAWASTLGCSVESDPPSGGGPHAGSGIAGSGGMPSAPAESSSGRITIIGDPMVRLGLGDTIDLAVRVLNDDDEPERRAVVTFNLVGRPDDSTLSSLVDTTDSEGIAKVTLRAASRPVTFEVRASIGTERSTSFSVSVSGAGFGTLVVRAPYEGVRAVANRYVLALPDVTCGEAAYATGDPRTVIAPGEQTATLVALPAEVPYAVLAIAESSSGVVVASGCEYQRCQRSLPEQELACEPLILRAQNELEVTVPYEDHPLTPASALDLEITMEAGSTAATLGSTIRSAINSIVRTTPSGQTALADAEGRFWLDSLDTVLREDEDAERAIAFADELAQARAESSSNGPESSLTALLQVNDEGAGVAASAMAAHVRDALDTLTLRAVLEYERGDTIAVRPIRIEALPIVEGTPEPRASLDQSDATTVDARLSSGDDSLQLSTLRFEPRLGALAADALERVLASDETGLGSQLTALAGCDSLNEWLGKQTFVHRNGCAEGCPERACAHSTARMLDAAFEALEAIDERRPYATLAGSLKLTDDDGDLRAEQMSAESIEGLWEPAADASLGDTLRGTAFARLPE
jgi:hypothetical protein